jgi:Fe(3+) dicitrate transport protein
MRFFYSLNIGIRGVATERSARITVLEDNIPIAPAPYSASASYYFPTAGRLQAVEVVKGPLAITQGPYSIGGALNLVSTAIPSQRSGKLLVEAGENNAQRLHAYYGGFNASGFGALLETHQLRNDGFQNIDNSNGDSGLDNRDYMLKLAYSAPERRHFTELKLHYNDQSSAFGYLGLTDADFAADPSRLYAASALDRITVEHSQIALRHERQLTDQIKLTATVFQNATTRKWLKTEGIDFNGSGNADLLRIQNWLSVVQAVNKGQAMGGYSAAQLQAILAGTLDTEPGSIGLRHNDCDYMARGIQLGLENRVSTEHFGQHVLRANIRYIHDEEDRLQRDDSYQLLTGRLVFNSQGTLGGAGNALQHADARAFYLQDEITLARWQLTMGVRNESVDQHNDTYTGGAARTGEIERSNAVDIWLPGAGLSYAWNDQLTLVLGAYKGFSTPSNKPGERPETAINYETGFRFERAASMLELMLFSSHYKNLVGVCTNSSGGACPAGAVFNGDAVTISGLEFSGTHTFTAGRFQIPLSFSATHTTSEFKTAIANTSFFGGVNKGDPLPYVPSNRFSVTAGLQTTQWSTVLAGSYVDSVCVTASCGAFEKTAATTLWDLASTYHYKDGQALYLRIENLFDKQVIVARHPYGVRGELPRTVSLGVRVKL